MHRVFVYGTLMRGEPNHSLLERSRCLGEARTEPRYNLFDLGPYPAMTESGETSVHGEVFEVSGEHLQAIDALEGHPDWYTRTPITLADGVLAETYLMEPGELARRWPLIVSGKWRERPVSRNDRED